ncbi:MAG: hypothetical protein ABI333_14820 [bacterium]
MKSLRKTSQRPGRVRLLIALVSVLPLTGAVGCAPELGNDPPPDFFEFDTETARIPEPTIAAVNQTTGMLDFSPLGIIVPKGPGACVGTTDFVIDGAPSVAECEFFQFLETLDGYPTLSPARAPVSAPIDMSTLTFAGEPDDNLAVVGMGGKITDLVVTYDEVNDYVVVDNPVGWDVGSLYVAGIRGYDNGVTTADGGRVVASVIYNLLKREESLLDCDPDDPLPDPTDLADPESVLDIECKYYELLDSMYEVAIPADTQRHATVVGLLISLEKLRQGFIGDGTFGVWGMTELLGGIPKAEAAVAWAFPIHSQSVVELQPALGMVPVPEGNNALRVAFKGTIDASSLVPFFFNPMDATVYLLNATLLLGAANVDPAAIVRFTPTVEGRDIVITAQNDFTDGHRYVMAMIVKENVDDPHAGVTDAEGRPFVPSPVTVFLRSRGELADADGISRVSKMDDATAAYAEENRVALLELFEHELWPSLTENLVRENVAYVFAFDYVAP